ncbi:NADH-quinone oxidoreductase subunit J [Ectobacillus sp. JY-23]|uniref:NADH-quinone oxidoreductase subunit J n=1 Tax=Ectobacillus sp. JY-23 TaxID=2933872 RepID=UPI001FF16C2A|nr:NADH-quinone oxidoreductase subunit J [Ectobacillus sp. JY-23]UOY91187.1 NADH-quinone oxidoreductase subunit J [Ectobacillus sp. JY-23]
MSGGFLAFLALSVIAIAGGVLMLHLTKVMHMMLALVFTFLSIAGLYFMLSAEFVGVVQILIYSGAVTIVMIFGIMLTKHDAESEGNSGWRSLLVLIGVLAFGAVMYYAVNHVDFSAATEAPLHEENTKQIGVLLYTKYIIPFEITSVLLLVALVGSIILAKGKEEKEHE